MVGNACFLNRQKFVLRFNGVVLVPWVTKLQNTNIIIIAYREVDLYTISSIYVLSEEDCTAICEIVSCKRSQKLSITFIIFSVQ